VDPQITLDGAGLNQDGSDFDTRASRSKVTLGRHSNVFPERAGVVEHGDVQLRRLLPGVLHQNTEQQRAIFGLNVTGSTGAGADGGSGGDQNPRSDMGRAACR
jgi:hypothetical protein